MDANVDIAPPAELVTRAQQAFEQRFGGEARLFCAPGRINIIGEHTDYSEGLVLPAAIDRFCITAIRPNGSDMLRVFSLDHGEATLTPRFDRTGVWTDYVAGVRAALIAEGVEAPGCDVVIGSNVPEGAGASSSAALEVSLAAGLLAAAGRDATPLQIARWCQKAENEYVGMPCGIMDQYASAHGVAGHALRIDCRDLSHMLVSIPAGLVFLLIDSTVRHKLVDGGYAARRADCEAAARTLGIPSLRDADEAMVRDSVLDERVRRRALHVVQENARVNAVSAALADNDAELAGRMMNESHESLRELFDVTCDETDALAGVCRLVEGVYGARQMGGGFGGAVVALTDAAAADDARAAIIRAYEADSGLKTDGLFCRIAGGVRELSV